MSTARPAASPANSVVVHGAAEVLRPPEDGLPYLRHDRAGELRLSSGGLAARDGAIVAVGPTRPGDAGAQALTVDATGCALVPGFVDCHTHLPFAGWRAAEYGQKVAGVPYAEIARGGGGIAASARALAAATDREVLCQAGALSAEMLQSGTTAFECKSGYGLSVDAERRALRLARVLGQDVPQATVRTALLAHAVPPGRSASEWMHEVCGFAPGVVAEAAASALDIFVEEVAFSNRDLARMGEIAAEAGVALRCHVEQFTTQRSIPVALAHGARSVDHLACLHPDDVAPLAAAECAAVLLPAAELLGDERVAPGRALADAGAICVLATDANPGTSPVLSMPLIVGLAVRRYGWSATEALMAATLNAAWVLGLASDRGSLEPGKRADFLLLDGPVDHVPYRFGRNPVVATVIEGRPAYVRPGDEWRFRQ